MKNKLLTTAKILLLALAATTFITTQSRAQRGDAAFNKGDNTIGVFAGIGLGYGYYNSAFSNNPLNVAIGLNYDHCTFEDVGPGNIGIGGILGYQSSKYDYSGSLSNYYRRYTHYLFAFRGTYHLTILKDKNAKFDPYAGITLGLRIYHYSDTYDDYYYSKTGYHYYNARTVPSVIKGVFIGAKYNFSPHVGVFAELGYDITVARGGLNFNF